MNARLRAKLIRGRNLPPPAAEGLDHFMPIIRRTAPRRRWWLRAFLAALVFVAGAVLAFLLLVAWVFRDAPFGGIH